jgi:hypothetical protein
MCRHQRHEPDALVESLLMSIDLLRDAIDFALAIEDREMANQLTALLMKTVRIVDKRVAETVRKLS